MLQAKREFVRPPFGTTQDRLRTVSMDGVLPYPLEKVIQVEGIAIDRGFHRVTM